jgi:hypothetical protein
MCGPTSAEKGTSAQQSSLAGQMSQNYGTTFAEQQDVLAGLNKAYSPIVSQGPGQQGFSPAELASRNTSAINATAGANRMAQQAAGNFAAGEGGGSSTGLTSGVTRQIQGSIASTQASNLANNENQIQQENFATGRDNYNRATAGLQFLAGTENANAAGSTANQGLGQSFNDESQIEQQQAQEDSEIGGLVEGGLGAGLSFVTGGGSFLKSGLNALAGKS